MALKHYVEFFYPGILVSETSAKEVSSRDCELELPKGAFGYRFYDVQEVELDGEPLRGKKKNYSGTYYLGQKFSLVQIKKQFPEETILIGNLEGSHEFAVKSPLGQWFGLNKDDVVVTLQEPINYN